MDIITLGYEQFQYKLIIESTCHMNVSHASVCYVTHLNLSRLKEMPRLQSNPNIIK
jgi:hypothetical protein